ncbi:hypothetical protein [Nonomuraea sp. NPDC048916]|uniref:hypothetical protein n=1 Tax=Nonomuraea sp. NPDC048916 TaxID=3154232 RepID=UPI0033E75D32
MFTTRSARFRRPAGSFSVRALGNALIALCLMTGALLMHGGACAALIISESGHVQHTVAESSRTDAQGEPCSHGQLPSGHRHGAEPDLTTSTTSDPDLPGTLDTPSAHSVVSVQLNARAQQHPPHKLPIIPPISRVMRI